MRAELASIKNLFLIHLDNQAFVNGTQAHVAGNSYLVPVLLLLGGLAILILPTFSGSLWKIGGLLAMLFSILTALSTRRSLQDEAKGTFIPFKLTNVSVKQRTEAGQVAADIASVVGDAVANSHRAPRGADDFYELHVEFSGTRPSGAPLNGKDSLNRPDLRDKPLPQVGDPAVVMYVSDSNYELL
jgi:hypothetical protein